MYAILFPPGCIISALCKKYYNVPSVPPTVLNVWVTVGINYSSIYTLLWQYIRLYTLLIVDTLDKEIKLTNKVELQESDTRSGGATRPHVHLGGDYFIVLYSGNYFKWFHFFLQRKLNYWYMMNTIPQIPPTMTHTSHRDRDLTSSMLLYLIIPI